MTPTDPMAPDTIRAVDLFCGAGGTSTGLALACEDLGLDVDLTCVNHWERALETHEENHPWAEHLHKDIHDVRPTDVVPDRHLDLLVASPECTHFSSARGGKPKNDQKRATPWVVLNWLEKLHVENFLIENVPDFTSWGPLDEDGRIVQDERGSTYQAYIRMLSSLGYSVQHEVLNAADYGDPTTRRRLFILGSRRGRPAWPEPTHAEDPSPDDGRQPWRPASSVIDWSDPGQSIWTRGLRGNGKRPLADSTMRRIAEGLQRFGSEPVAEFAPYVEALGQDGVRDLQEDVVPAEDVGDAVLERGEPFLVKFYGTSTVADVEDPSPTVTAGGWKLALATPYILGQHGGARPRNVEDSPMNTIATGGAISLINPEAFVLPRNGYYGGTDRPNRARDPRAPLHTVTASNHDGHLVSPYLVPFYGERDGQDPRTHDPDEPLPTVPASKSPAGVSTPFLVRYYNHGDADDIGEPLGTVTTRDRFALVVPDLHPGVGLDIRFRMLQPPELAGAMGFPTDYEFVGTKTETVRQIGNAVCVGLARHLCRALLGERGDPMLLDYQDEAAPEVGT